MSFFYTNPDVTILVDSDKELEAKCREFTQLDLPFFNGQGKVTGSVTISPPRGKSVSHKGIQLELFGDYRTEKGALINRFFSRKQFLQPAGDLTCEYQTDFVFDNVSFPTATYFGTAVNVVYGVEVRLVRFLSDFVMEKQIVVVIFQRRPRSVTQHKEVGIRNILHVEFVFPKGYYSANEAVVGAAYFILVRLRIVFMSMSLYRREVYNGSDAQFKKVTVLKDYEIMDGAPCRGDHTPIRIFMGDTGFWPFINFRGSPLQVEHYLRVMMIDENGKKYFKRMRLEFGRYTEEQCDEEDEQEEE